MRSLENLKAVHTRRRMLVVLLITASLGFVPVGFSASNDTPRSIKNASSSMNQPVNRGQQFPDGIIDGAVNPEMIPDRTAYTLLFRMFNLSQQATGLEKERASSFAEDAGFIGKDNDQLLAVAREFRRKISPLDNQVAEIKDRNWPKPGPEIMEQLEQLQREKETKVDELVASLPSQLGSDAQQRLHSWVNNHVKRRVKLVPTSPSAANPHHTSFHLLNTPIITFASSNLSATSYSANLRPAVQSMGYGATYSDMWLNSNWNRIWGAGVTEDNYNAYGHWYYVTTRLTSPNGRIASVTSYTSSSYAYAEVRLDWPSVDSDLGDYVTETEHSTLCPYIGFWIAMAHTRRQYRIGRSAICYKFFLPDPGGGACIYFPVDGCNVPCMRSEVRLIPPHPTQGCPNYAGENVRWKKPENGAYECKYNEAPMNFNNSPCLCFVYPAPF